MGAEGSLEQGFPRPLFPLPAEKAMKASLFLNRPLSSRKWVGSKALGFLNCVGSNWEVQSKGMMLRSYD